jgi:L,D-peptidoglycan transpeptidase YkuD (ErfK/YbiS/YcfS/YnhG family)
MLTRVSLFWFACAASQLATSQTGVPTVTEVARFLAALGLRENSRQVLLVVADGWESSGARLQLCTKSEDGWKLDHPPIPVRLGRNGIGWGRGKFRLLKETGPHKVEGDGKSPAGIFELGEAFGYSATPPPACRLQYRVATERDYFVDDPEAKEYNSWVRLPLDDNSPQRRWRSFERMKVESNAYELGIIVKHNMSPVSAGQGSAIFLHIWGGPDSPTAGCTAMARENMLKLLSWLDPSDEPLLIQLPEAELREVSLKFQGRRSLFPNRKPTARAE